MDLRRSPPPSCPATREASTCCDPDGSRPISLQRLTSLASGREYTCPMSSCRNSPSSSSLSSSSTSSSSSVSSSSCPDINTPSPAPVSADAHAPSAQVSSLSFCGVETFPSEEVSTNETQRSERPRELTENGKKADTDCVSAISASVSFLFVPLRSTRRPSGPSTQPQSRPQKWDAARALPLRDP